MVKTRRFSFMIALIAIPVILYFYFLKWRTNTIYGDDLNIFISQSSVHGLWARMKLDIAFGKFRPIHGFLTDLLISGFQKNLAYYYLFNILVQVVNTFLLAALLNLFLKRLLLSLCFGLIAGLSGFTFFNISQLFNGGALEGLAITFFLLSLFYMTRILIGPDPTVPQQVKGILLGLLFANLCMYTHERYIVLFPFIIMVLYLFPGLRSMGQRRKFLFSLLAVGSILLNVLIKKVFFSMPFFVGTGGTNISFSFSSAFSFFTQAVLSIFQFNTGPEYLVGLPFSRLSDLGKTAVILLALSLVSLFVAYLTGIRKAFIQKDRRPIPKFILFLLLMGLFALLLAPAVVTIRLEQRWLQASFNLFILMIALVASEVPFRKDLVQNGFFILLVLLFTGIEWSYFYKGAPNLYMVYSERTAEEFEQAVHQGIIRPETSTLTIWEKKKDADNDNAINWDLGAGTFFGFYMNKNKKIVFADSASSPYLFDSDSGQALFIENGVIHTTGGILKN